MQELSSVLTLISAMITPAILIMATGSLLLTTSQRLSRGLERTRKMFEQFYDLSEGERKAEMSLETIEHIFSQIKKASRRSRLLQHAMSALYITLSIFVATSVSIGIVGTFHVELTWFPIMLGILGIAILFYCSVILIIESRIAVKAVKEETAFVLKTGNDIIASTRKGKK